MASRGKALSQVVKAFRELNPRSVASEGRRTVRVGVIAATEVLQEVAAFLLGDEPSAFDNVGDALLLVPMPPDPAAFAVLPKCDIVLHAADYMDNLPGVPTGRIFQFASKDDLPALVKEVLQREELEYARIPLATTFPAFRSEAAVQIIQTVSIENAIFVASTSLGNIIPNPLQPLVSVAESLGDLVVLTANQLRMLFRLAAIFGRPVGFREQAPEVMSILAAAFGWRSVARELVSKVPLGGGVIAKAAIAFAGTWALGDGIVYYYATGKRLSKQELRERFDAAYVKGKVAVEPIVGKLKEVYSKGRARLMNEPDDSSE